MPQLVVTAPRARALGIETSTPIAIELDADTDVATILSLVTDAKPNQVVERPTPAGPAAVAAD